MIRDCTHPVARHVHGTPNAYILDKCRCEPCRAANTLRERSRTRQKAYGRYEGLVDAEPVREHVRRLSEQGVGLKQITRLAGVSGGVLTKLMYGNPRSDGTRRPPSKRCTPRVRDRVLSVPLTALADGALVDGTGTRRRLQALVATGWSQCKLADKLGMARANFGKTIKSDRVCAGTAAAVRGLYDELWDRPPPQADHRDKIAYSRALHLAAERGWRPPLTWDDDTIDDPHYRPQVDAEAVVDEVAVAEAMHGRAVRLTRAERAEAVRHLTALGYSAKQIAERLHTTGRSVVRNRGKAA